MKTAVVFFSIMACSMPSDKGKLITTQANMRLLENVVSQFRMDAGRLPTADEGLNALILQPTDVRNWPLGGYLETTDIPRDGWGHDFVYVLDPNLPRGFGIYSCGLDGVTVSNGNDRDDLNTWNVRSPWRAYYQAHADRKAMMSRAASLAIVLLIVAAAVLILWKGFGAGRQPA